MMASLELARSVWQTDSGARIGQVRPRRITQRERRCEECVELPHARPLGGLIAVVITDTVSVLLRALPALR